LFPLRYFVNFNAPAPTPTEAVAFKAMDGQDPPDGGDDDHWQNDFAFTAPTFNSDYDVNPQTVSSFT
jgi:hypothetical protein